MASPKELELKSNDGKWEPMIIIAALVAAVWLGYVLYGDRIFPQDALAKAKSQEMIARPG